MNKKLKFFIPVILFGGLIVMFADGLYRDPTLVPSPFIGKQAPEFKLPNLLQPEQTLSHKDMLGEVVSLVNVWASWCPGCAREHEMLLAIAREAGVPIFGLNWKDERFAAMRWLEERGNPYFAVAADYDNVVGIDWGVYGAPETFLLDSKGIILYKLVGPLTPDIWEREFAPRILAASNSMQQVDTPIATSDPLVKQQ